MRTTVDIEDDIFRIVKSLARERKKPFGVIISKLIREALTPKLDKAASRNGFPLFEINQPGIVVTNDIINRIKEEEDI